MRFRLGVLGLIILGLLLCHPEKVLAQSLELTQAFQQGQALIKKERYSDAIPFLKKAFDLGVQEFGPDHMTVANLLDRLALPYFKQGRFAAAVPLIKRSLVIKENGLGKNHLTVAQGIFDLALLYDKQAFFAEAERLYNQSLTIREMNFGQGHSSVVIILNNLAAMYYTQGNIHLAKGRYKEAEPYYVRSLEIKKKTRGPNSTYVAAVLSALAEVYEKQDRPADAERFYKQSLSIYEKSFGPYHQSVATSLYNLSGFYQDRGRYSEAGPLAKRALASREKALGPEHLIVAQSLFSLANLYELQNHYAHAQPLYKRSLEIKEKHLGTDHPDVATNLSLLARVYHAQGRYAEAAPLYKRALIIREKKYGPEHSLVATNLYDLAKIFERQNRYDDAETYYSRSLSIRKRTLGTETPAVAQVLNGLASLYKLQGRFGKAEKYSRKSLTIYEKVDGPVHKAVADAVNLLARIYHNQGRYKDAEALYKRSLLIAEKAYGPDSLAIATFLQSLGVMYNVLGRNLEAEPLLKRALSINTKILKPGHPSLASNLHALSRLHHSLGHLVKAEQFLIRAIKSDNKVFGPEHRRIGMNLNNLAMLYLSQGKYAKAEPLFIRSVKIAENALGNTHIELARPLHNIAHFYSSQGQGGKALSFIRRATEIHRKRAKNKGGYSVGNLSERKSVRYDFSIHVGTSFGVMGNDSSKRTLLTAEAFSVAQLAQATQAGAAVSRMAERFAAGNDDLAKIVRDHQDAVAIWQKLDADLIKVVSSPPDKRNPRREEAMRKRLDDLDAKIATLSKTLATEFPSYSELAAANPVPLSDVQKLLGSNEALVAYLVSKNKTFVWVVRQNRAELFRADVGREVLKTAVAELRGSLDVSGLSQLSDLPPFNRSAAHKLFKQIFAPAVGVLKGARHVFTVPDGALQSLPLGVLVTDEPKGEFKDFSGYNQVPWLAKKYALTTLPSVSSLRALRTFAKRAKASIPFTGFGDPLLKGHPGGMRGISIPALYKAKSQKELSLADTSAVRNLPPLPDTADELKALSAAVNGDAKYIYLREAATEKTVKNVDLSNSRIITFATHGLVAGDLKNAEPALVLTPPRIGTALDDGLLTSSEVAQLKLNADLVILSACNTAAGDDSEGAEGLSGLAKAFFYAGSRALLVSHWPVVSDAAVKLTTGMLNYRAKNPTTGRSEALRQSMLALMNSRDKPHYAHPLFWAPFVVVGEGGVYSAN